MKSNKTSKKQRRAWWKSLSPEEQHDYIERVMDKKTETRRERSSKIMAEHAGKFSCSDCFHRETQSCLDDLPNGCEYWFNPQSVQQGPGYDEVRRKKGEVIPVEEVKIRKVVKLPDAGQECLQKSRVGMAGGTTFGRESRKRANGKAYRN